MHAPELAPSAPPRKQFRAVVATYDLSLPEMIEAVLQQMLPEYEVHVYAPPTNLASALLNDPELSRAHLIVALMSNLRYDTPATPQGCDSPITFLRMLRPKTRAVLMITTAHWKEHTGATFLEAGADFAVPIPFSIATIEQVVKKAVLLE